MVKAAALGLVFCAPIFCQVGYTLTAVAAGPLNRPCAAAADSSGTLYIADSLNHRVRRIRNGVVDTVAGNGTQGYSGDGAAATAAQLNTPCGVAVDGSGNLFISDSANHRVRRVTNGTITTVAGTGALGLAGDNGAATAALLAYPLGLAVDAAGALYIADSANHRIRKVSGGNITTVAGSSGALSLPSAVGLGASGELYILDSGNSRLLRVSGSNISTVAGGVFRDARGLVVDVSGMVFVADSGNQRIVSVLPSGVVTAIAGNGTAGTCGEDMVALGAQLATPYGLATSHGTLFVADYRGNRLVRLDLALIPTGPLTPRFRAADVVSFASRQGPQVAPGEIVSIAGSGFGPAATVAAQVNAGLLATELARTRVYFDGRPAPLLYVVAGQVAAVVPYEVSGPCTVVEVEYNGVRSAPAAIPVTDHVPGMFSGSGQAVVLNQDGSLNSAAKPAPRGSAIVAFVTGEGQTSPAGVDGKVAAGSVLPTPLVTPSAYFGSIFYGSGAVVPAQLVLAGGVPGATAGLMQLKVTVPGSAPTGAAVPFYVYFGNTRSKTEMTVAIQ